jgi:hypothetical protein
MTPEHPDFQKDYMDLEYFGGNALAKKWIDAYRKAQNSNVIRKQWCDQKDKIIAELNHEVSVARNLAKLAKDVLDEQSKRTAILEEGATRGNKFCYDLMGNCNVLRIRCWNLEDQNIQLREALVEERAKFIWGSKDSRGEFADSIHTSMWNSIKKHDLETAKEMFARSREQLRRENVYEKH